MNSFYGETAVVSVFRAPPFGSSGAVDSIPGSSPQFASTTRSETTLTSSNSSQSMCEHGRFWFDSRISDFLWVEHVLFSRVRRSSIPSVSQLCAVIAPGAAMAGSRTVAASTHAPPRNLHLPLLRSRHRAETNASILDVLRDRIQGEAFVQQETEWCPHQESNLD